MTFHTDLGAKFAKNLGQNNRLWKRLLEPLRAVNGYITDTQIPMQMGSADQSGSP